MPRIFRVMKKETDDKPVVEGTGKGLGVRCVPVNSFIDVDLDSSGKILLNGKGMSVAPNWRDLPYFLIPRRLKSKVFGARGAVDTFCFRMGEGPFQDGPVSSGLALKQDSPAHGNVVPDQVVTAARFQADLANTRDQWVVDET